MICMWARFCSYDFDMVSIIYDFDIVSDMILMWVKTVKTVISVLSEVRKLQKHSVEMPRHCTAAQKQNLSRFAMCAFWKRSHSCYYATSSKCCNVHAIQVTN